MVSLGRTHRQPRGSALRQHDGSTHLGKTTWMNASGFLEHAPATLLVAGASLIDSKKEKRKIILPETFSGCMATFGIMEISDEEYL